VAVFADSHVHLADAAFTDDVDAVIDRARAAGVRALICIGESPAAALRAQAITERYPGLVFHTCGVHPYEAASWDADRDVEAIRLAAAKGAVAVGECGLDYSYDTSTPEQQRQVLNAQLDIASALSLPVILHTRQAEADTIAFLADAARAKVRGVLHCFTGSIGLAEAGLVAGWYVSFSGIITFRSWTDEAVLRLVPDDRVLVESDAPYLAPVPNRGKRNESAFVSLTLAHLAAVRGTSAEVLGLTALANTRCLFALPVPPADTDHSS